jgi:protein TonB
MLSLQDKHSPTTITPALQDESAINFTLDRKALMVKAVDDASVNILAGHHLETQSEDDRNWDDIVFEKRNQDYGAYILRRGYASNVLLGLIFTGLILIFIICYSSIAAIFRSSERVDAVAPRKLIYTELSLPPPIDKPKPPPPQIQLPKLQKVIKFVPPKVVKEQIIEEVPTIEEIKQNETAAVNVEGAAVVFDEPVEEVVVEDDDELFTIVEQNPEFEGGEAGLVAFLRQNMVYPPNARRMQVEGTVYVSFIVNKNGSISDVKVMRGIMKECDREAVRVVEMMPPWKPGKQNGRSVNVRFTMPLKFRLH